MIFIFYFCSIIIILWFNQSDNDVKIKLYLQDCFDDEWRKIDADISFETNSEYGIKYLQYKNYYLSTKVAQGKTAFGPSHISYSFRAPVDVYYYTENDDIVAKEYGEAVVLVELNYVDKVNVYILKKDANGEINSKPTWDETTGLDMDMVYEKVHAGEKEFEKVINQLHENVFLKMVVKYMIGSFAIILCIVKLPSIVKYVKVHMKE